ncbi:glycine cleavage system protein H [Enterobacterales bacterium CwR94]|nr:glycine cleavage system protein H [Enterobacterales bacterium CwR94]
MSNVPDALKYSEEHEWVREESEGVYVVGITDHAQALLGDVVFVDLPEMNAVFAKGKEVGVIESVKAASDIYTPISGEVIEINDALGDSPEIVNSDPYHAGWIFKIKASDVSELDNLLNADDYRALIKE